MFCISCFYSPSVVFAKFELNPPRRVHGFFSARLHRRRATCSCSCSSFCLNNRHRGRRGPAPVVRLTEQVARTAFCRARPEFSSSVVETLVVALTYRFAQVQGCDYSGPCMCADKFATNQQTCVISLFRSLQDCFWPCIGAFFFSRHRLGRLCSLPKNELESLRMSVYNRDIKKGSIRRIFWR